ncbi:MAG: selenocysteine-specific translation elongation factor [Dethiobacter sp.]|nr:selenocysteine-specific translation elongation factor [Dethiobacter sp.]MBS4022118.1 selenocysteine-specific translation elongation factor [Dethiobacter sp.]
MPHVIIGTAGHVDHGKTALIKALTGEDTDRLREEKERGISIELGFAPFRLPGGRLAGVIDVPGHERFIHNMLAGIGGIDLVLLVVDVSEGVMPQTREHVEIMELLKIARGIVVLAKVDLADDEEWLDMVEEEVRDALAGTFLADAPFHRVSAHTGKGLKELLVQIDLLTGELPSRDATAPLRLPVDRVFSMTGFGTVVTGTLLAGRIATGMNVEILPLGRQARVRQMQVHGAAVDEAIAGQRVAVNLAGVEKETLERGSVLAAPGSLSDTSLLDARLYLLKSAPRAVKNLTRVHVFLGAGRTVGRIALLDCDELQPGGEALVQLRLEHKLVAHAGDRYIIRSYSPMTTIGGGVVLDAHTARHRRKKEDVLQRLKELEKGDPAVPVLQRIRRDAVVLESVLQKQSGLPPESLSAILERLQQSGEVQTIDGLLVDGAGMADWRRRLLEALTAFHAANPLSAGISRAELKNILPKAVAAKVYGSLLSGMTESGEISESGDLVSLAGHEPAPGPEQARLLERLTVLYREGGFTPPTLREVVEQTGIKPALAESLLSYLARRGEVVRLDDQLALHHEHFSRAKELLCEHFRSNKSLAAGEFRDKLGTSRKFVLPLLETFDRMKWTRRMGDERVPWRLDLSSREVENK